MIRVRGLVRLVLLLALFPLMAHAQTASEWLLRMNDAMQTLNYEGTFVYQQGENMKTMSLVHGVIDGVEHERLTSLVGSPMEIIRNGDHVVCIWPERKEKLIADRSEFFAPQLPRDLQALPEQYEARLDGQDQMTGRPAHVIVLEPVDRYRYGYRLWLASDSALLLRSDVIGADGEVVEQLMFTDLKKRDGVSAADFEPAYGDIGEFTEMGVAPSRRETAIQDPEWTVTDPPPGFSAVSHNRDRMDEHHIVQHTVLSDGLASVSVFIESGDESGFTLDGVARMGAVNAYGRHMQGYTVTVVGEVPVKTLQRIADSTVRVDGED